MIAEISGALAAVVGAAWAVRGRSSQLLAPSVWHGKRTRKAVALTFDDGPSPGTATILDLLAQSEATATFFQCGQNVQRHPELARAVSAAGHEIGNHTWSHRRLDFASKATMRDEIGSTQQLLIDVHGTRPQWFRAPFGVRWWGLGQVQAEFGLQGAMWTCLARDWKLPAAHIAHRVNRATENGAIICLHDGRGTASNPNIDPTVAAVAQILLQLRADGWAILPLSKLI